jgi:hypothetical protein
VASDSLRETNVSVVINVRDTNDMPPVFDQPLYEVGAVEEALFTHSPLLKVESQSCCSLTKCTLNHRYRHILRLTKTYLARTFF